MIWRSTTRMGSDEIEVFNRGRSRRAAIIMQNKRLTVFNLPELSRSSVEWLRCRQYSYSRLFSF
jgi:hypothetical protein